MVDKESGPNKEGGSDNGDNGPNIEVDKESGPCNVVGGSFYEVDMENGPINDIVFETEGVVDKYSENLGQTFNRDESENVGTTEGREVVSEDDSAF